MINKRTFTLITLVGLAIIGGCRKQNHSPAPPNSPASLPAATDHQAGKTKPKPTAAKTRPRPKRDYKLVHVIVALCDNKHQGIALVPAALGNGQDPRNNLYWGAMYGLKTYFRKSSHWTRVKVPNQSPLPEHVLETAYFQNRRGARRVLVKAFAYDGRHMKAALESFFREAAAGDADLVCFVGHNGLMDVRRVDFPKRTTVAGQRDAVVLACKSQAYFAGPLRQAGRRPLITTTGLMAPEAYTLDAIIRSWARGESPASIRNAAAAAYAKYQKCSLKAAKRLFATENR
ncbi:MAG: hypothetical protein K8S55_03030 [Phycisphaerae bacterium]|nr:hypothetical protein [Phycisphaerae bacterium]